MAKIKRQNTAKTVSISQNCFGEKITVKTKKTCVGNPVLEDQKCKTCIAHKTSDVALVCLCKAGLDKIVATKKKRAPRSKKPFASAICIWVAGGEKKEIIDISLECGLSDNAAKRFANDIFLVAKSAIGLAQKKDGLLARYLAWAIYGEGEEPTGCPSTIGFAKNFSAEFVKFTI